MADILQKTFQYIFWNENHFILNWISLKLVHKGPIDNKLALVQVTASHNHMIIPFSAAYRCQ